MNEQSIIAFFSIVLAVVALVGLVSGIVVLDNFRKWVFLALTSPFRWVKSKIPPKCRKEGHLLDSGAIEMIEYPSINNTCPTMADVTAYTVRFCRYCQEITVIRVIHGPSTVKTSDLKLSNDHLRFLYNHGRIYKSTENKSGYHPEWVVHNKFKDVPKKDNLMEDIDS